MKALILIGGEGTRLRPLTYKTLKCMVLVANRPFFEYQLAFLKKYGIREIVLSVCHMPDKVKKAVGNGKKYGVKIIYAAEKNPLGTAGAIKNAEKYLDDTTIVMNGDILTDIKIDEMYKVHKNTGAKATIALHEVRDPSAFGLVLTGRDKKVKSFVEKPKQAPIGGSWINAGIYIFSKDAVCAIPEGRQVSVERETFPGIISAGGKLFSYKSGAYWLDIGKIENYKQANFDVMSGRYNSALETNTQRKPGILKGSKNIIKAGAVLSAPLIIGNSCNFGNGVSLKKSIIWDRVKIGRKAVVEDSVIGSNCIIDAGAVLKGVVLQNGTKVRVMAKNGKID